MLLLVSPAAISSDAFILYAWCVIWLLNKSCSNLHTGSISPLKKREHFYSVSCDVIDNLCCFKGISLFWLWVFGELYWSHKTSMQNCAENGAWQTVALHKQNVLGKLTGLISILLWSQFFLKKQENQKTAYHLELLLT